jgi:hypothetical protein
MKQLLILLLIGIITTNVKAQLGNYNSNGKAKILSEKAWLQITTKGEEVKAEKENAAAIAGALLGPLVDVGVAVAKEKAKQNAAKFKNSYIVNASGSGFWESSNKANLPVLTVTRKVILDNDKKTEAVALKITLVPELSPDKTAFRFVATNTIVFEYTSAKTKGDHDYIDITLDIKFKALLINKSQYEVKDLRGTSVLIPMVKVGETTFSSDVPITSGWLPFPAKPTLEIETDVTEKEIKTVKSSGKKEGKEFDDKSETETTTVKKKAKDIERIKENSGLYEFEVTVMESNPYKIKAENKQKMIESSGDASAAFLKAIVDAIFKKEEPKEEEKETEEQ